LTYLSSVCLCVCAVLYCSYRGLSVSVYLYHSLSVCVFLCCFILFLSGSVFLSLLVSLSVCLCVCLGLLLSLCHSLIGRCTLMLRCTFGCSRALLTSHLNKLWSSTTDSLFVPAVRLSTVGRRAFPVAGACIWNDLQFYYTAKKCPTIIL